MLINIVKINKKANHKAMFWQTYNGFGCWFSVINLFDFVFLWQKYVKCASFVKQHVTELPAQLLGAVFFPPQLFCVTFSKSLDSNKVYSETWIVKLVFM